MCRNIVPLNNLAAAKRQARSAERYEAIRVYQDQQRAARAMT